MTIIQSKVELQLNNEGLSYEVFKNRQMLVDFGGDYLYYYSPTTNKYRRQGTNDWYKAQDTSEFINIVKEVIEADAEIAALKKRQAEVTAASRRKKTLELMKDYLAVTDKYDIQVYTRGNSEVWLFEVEGTEYRVDFEDCKYYPNGRTGYKYIDCLSMLETIKLYFWEYRGIEVFPDIELLPLLKTEKAKNMQNRRKPYPNPKKRIESLEGDRVEAPY